MGSVAIRYCLACELAFLVMRYRISLKTMHVRPKRAWSVLGWVTATRVITLACKHLLYVRYSFINDYERIRTYYIKDSLFVHVYYQRQFMRTCHESGISCKFCLFPLLQNLWKISNMNVFSGVFILWNALNIVQHTRSVLNFHSMNIFICLQSNIYWYPVLAVFRRKHF